MVTKTWMLTFAVVVMGLAHSLQAGQQQRVSPHLVRVPAAEVSSKALDSRLLPSGGSVMAVDRNQVFRLEIPGTDFITLVPAVYELNHGNSFADCGLFLLKSGVGPARFLSTLTHERTLPELINCGGVQAVGLMTSDGARPRVLLLYNVYSPHTNLSVGVVLAWAGTSQGYEVDRILDDDHNPVRSIADIRSQLSPASSPPHSTHNQ